MDFVVPSRLKKIKPKVEKLYFKGGWDERFFTNCLAVVGSRRMTNYGRQALEKLIPPLVEAGVTIVSGYMYGVDREAQRLALACGGRSIAVLGWGIDWGHEPEQKNLLFLSEYPAKQRPQLWMFPRRNRIVAGLSQRVLIVEAAAKSGSLITADFALRYKRGLFAVPGPITSKASEGANKLIRDGLAKMVLSAEDVWPAAKTRPEAVSDNLLLNSLREEALSVDELAAKFKKSVAEIGVELSLLQLKGEIIENNGRYYIKI